MSENRITIGIRVSKPNNIGNPPAPVKIGNYSYYTSDEIGLGYISHVYLGKNDITGQLVAIKIMDCSKEDDIGQQLIEEEIDILKLIKEQKCRHLLKLYDCYRINNILYLITQFCEGKDVAKILRSKKKLSEIQAQTIMKHFINSYQELSKLRIIHRDLKPANILIKEGEIKLADFGFSHRTDKNNMQGQFNVGSPNYMSPEALKRNQYSIKSDIWAIGIIAFELIYGRLPWKQKVQSLQYQKITQTNIQDIFDSSIFVSQHYKAFIRSCLQISLEKRASPEFLFNYKWPEAKDFVQGLKNGQNARPMSILNDLRPNRLVATAHNISPSKNQSLDKSSFTNLPMRSKSPNLLLRQTMRLNQSYRHSIAQKSLQKSHKVIMLGSQKAKIMKIINSQIEYCQFIFNLYVLTQTITVDGNTALSQLVMLYLIKILKELKNFSNNQNSHFLVVPGINEFKQSDGWPTACNKIRNLLNILSFDYLLSIQSKLQSKQMQLSLAIKKLTFNLQENYRVVQQLVYLYQLQKMLSGLGVNYFSQNSKINLLLNRKSKQQQTFDKKTVICHRLRQKMNLLNL